MYERVEHPSWRRNGVACKTTANVDPLWNIDEKVSPSSPLLPLGMSCTRSTLMVTCCCEVIVLLNAGLFDSSVERRAYTSLGYCCATALLLQYCSAAPLPLLCHCSATALPLPCHCCATGRLPPSLLLRFRGHGQALQGVSGYCELAARTRQFWCLRVRSIRGERGEERGAQGDAERGAEGGAWSGAERARVTSPLCLQAKSRVAVHDVQRCTLPSPCLATRDMM